jgi:ABC-2 type transport system ATP-binding protein
MAGPAVEFREVTKTYRRRLSGLEVVALTHVSFSVSQGEVCAFVGPNGAGKTTSINILMGFLYADWGQIRVLGHEPGDVCAKSRVGFVPENFAFYKHLNAEKLLRFHAKLAGVEESKTASLIPDLIGKVRLNGSEKLKIGRYSRGMVQRIGIAQALLADPDLLVLDEPTSGLDPAGRREVRDLILALKAAGKTIFLSSHILSEVEQICDQAIIIKQGRVVRAGSMTELLSAGDQIEIVADRLTAELEILVREWGASLEPGAQGMRITLASGRKRELVERLWSAGCDVLSLRPVKGSLEDFYMKVVGGGDTV